jgi:hypothetical protein
MYGFRKAGRMSREIEDEAATRDLGELRDRCRALAAQFEQDQARLQRLVQA